MHIDEENGLIFDMDGPHTRPRENYLSETGRKIWTGLKWTAGIATLIGAIGWIGDSNKGREIDHLFNHAEEVRSDIQSGYQVKSWDYQDGLEESLRFYQSGAKRDPSGMFSEAELIKIRTELDQTNVFNLSRPLTKTK